MNDTEKAVKILQNGGIIIYPTDTAFGIGCRIDKPVAVERLFALRDRPSNQAVPVLAGSQEMALKYLQPPVDPAVMRLMDDFWPGGLTIVYPCRESMVPELVRGGGKTLGIRLPDHDLIKSVIQQMEVPILGPSANIHGQQTPYIMDQLDPELVSQVDFVLPGECKKGMSSTVIDCSVNPWKILRQGAVSLDSSDYEK